MARHRLRRFPENIEWVVSGRATFSGVTGIVHAPTRTEALAKAKRGEFIDGVDINGADLVDWDMRIVTPNVAGED